MERIATITDVTYAIEKSKPPNLVVTAKAEVNSGGWIDATLLRRVYFNPPVDGIWEYDFLATPPSGPATGNINELEASDVWKDYDEARVKGVRVYGEGKGVKEIVF